MDEQDNRTGFARISIRVLGYVVMAVIIAVFAVFAFRFGNQIFSDKGVDEAPGTDMTFTVDEGTTINQLGKTLEEFRVIKSSTVFRVQAVVYGVSNVKEGTYTFNTSQGGEDIFKVISAGPEEELEIDEKGQ